MAGGVPTIRSVAERAGVSKSLVSLVMRGSPQVSEARRMAVLEAATELGYRTNALARSLGQRRTQSIGVVVSDLANPVFLDMLGGFEEVSEAAGLRIVLGGGRRDAARVARLIDTFVELRVEAISIFGTVPGLRRDALPVAACPVVLVSSPDLRARRVDVVDDDDVRGAVLAVEHLISLGHRRIAHIAGPPGGVARSRRAGYEDAMRRARRGRWIRVENGDFTEETGYRAGLRLLRHPGRRPQAIFGCDDMAAVGVLTAADELGIPVPGRLSVVGYDDTTLARIGHVSLTSVDPNGREIGRRAAAFAVERIERPGRRARRRLVTPSLVVRGTTAPPLDA